MVYVTVSARVCVCVVCVCVVCVCVCGVCVCVCMHNAEISPLQINFREIKMLTLHTTLCKQSFWSHILPLQH